MSASRDVATSWSRVLGMVAVAAFAISAAGTSARGDVINAFLYELTNNGFDSNSVGVEIKIEDVSGGVQVTASVLKIPDMTLGSGDILALWFDVDPAVNLASVNYSAPYDPSDLNITGFVKGHNAVRTAPFGGNPNINGMPAPFNANYDIAVKLGTNGASTDFYPTASFKLTNLTTSDFTESRFAARVTSIGTSGDSGKYAGFAEQPPVVPTPSAALGGLALAGLISLRRRRAGSL